MDIAIIESPFASFPYRNKAYLTACIRDAVCRGYAPYASHRMMTDALDDTNPSERDLGMSCVLPFLDVADRVLVYADLDISSGMEWGIERARERDIPVECMHLPGLKKFMVTQDYQGLLMGPDQTTSRYVFYGRPLQGDLLQNKRIEVFTPTGFHFNPGTNIEVVQFGGRTYTL